MRSEPYKDKNFAFRFHPSRVLVVTDNIRQTRRRNGLTDILTGALQFLGVPVQRHRRTAQQDC